MKPALAIKNLTVSYDNHPILHNLNLSIDQGSLVAFVGPNGSGKSTLMQSIMGLLPSSGTIAIFDQPSQYQRHKIAYIPQRSCVDWTFPISAFDVVMMGRYGHLKFGQRPSEQDTIITQQALEKVALTKIANQPIGKLSGGQQQRVFLARALAQQADMYIMDEPFAGVDRVTEEIMLNLFLQLKQDKKTIIVVHHDIMTVKKYFDSVFLMNRKIIAHGPTATTLTAANMNQTFRSSIDIHDLNFL